MAIEALEWEEDFREYIKNLPLSNDDYKGVMEYIDEGCELLKEQEPVKPIRLENWWKCPSCSGNIVANMQYCPGCGRSVKWE